MTANEIRSLLSERAMAQAGGLTAIAPGIGLSRVNLSQKLAGDRPIKLDELVAIAAACGLQVIITKPRPHRR